MIADTRTTPILVLISTLKRIPPILLSLMAIAFSACAGRSDLAQHSFAFDALSDSPGIYVLDYRYGDSKQPGARNPDYLRQEGRSLQRTGVNGEMRRGDVLYVKWRIEGTGELHEETVDLRHRLPADITDHMIYFIIKGPKLYVYLITPERRPQNMPPNGPRPYQYLKTITIYPDQAKD